MAKTKSLPGSEVQESFAANLALRAGGSLPLACAMLVLAACSTTPDAAPYEPNASMGMLIARNSCVSCHETFSSSESPEPRAPAFREIVNRPGMTPDALATWLRDAHNYPIEMGFHLEPHQADSLVLYMIGMQSDEPTSES